LFRDLRLTYAAIPAMATSTAIIAVSIGVIAAGAGWNVNESPEGTAYPRTLIVDDGSCVIDIEYV